MTAADIAFLVILAVSCLIGIWRGLVREALSLATWVLAILAAGFFGPDLAQTFTNAIGSETVRRILAYSLIFIVIMFTGTLVAKLVSKLSSAAGLGAVDRVLGSLFGLLRGVVIVVIILLLTMPLEVSLSWYDGSVLLPYLLDLMETLQSWLGLDVPPPPPA